MILKKGVCLILFAILVANFVFIMPLNPKQAKAMEGLLPQYEPLQHVSTNPNLYVSAENPLFKNYFAGPMIIEVIVTDPNISRLDQSYGEPIVTVNGKRLRMAQATDGNWYAYFADRNQAELAGKTAPVAGHGLNFGWFCGPGTTFSISSPNAMKSGVEYGQTNGFTMARNVFHNGTLGDPQSPALLNVGKNPPDCNINSYTSPTAGITTEHVVRENKTLNTNLLGFSAGNTYEAMWPIIQLYDFSSIPTPVTVDYHRAGGDQMVNLIFDRIPSNEIGILADRPDFPRGAQVQGDLLDPQLNIDPTDTDSWTWGTSPANNTLYYMAFGKDSKPDADGLVATGNAIMPGFSVTSATPMQNLIGNLTAFMFNHNGRLLEDAEPQGVIVARLQSNGIQTLFADSNGFMRTRSISAFSIPITASELQPNAGIFSDYDEGGISDLVILDNAERGKSFTITYNDVAYSIVVKSHNAKLTMG